MGRIGFFQQSSEPRYFTAEVRGQLRVVRRYRDKEVKKFSYEELQPTDSRKDISTGVDCYGCRPVRCTT